MGREIIGLTHTNTHNKSILSVLMAMCMLVSLCGIAFMNRASAGAYEDDVAAMADAGVVVDFMAPAVSSGNDFVWTVDDSTYKDTPEFYIDFSYHLEDSVITGKDYNDIPKYFTFYTDAACTQPAEGIAMMAKFPKEYLGDGMGNLIRFVPVNTKYDKGTNITMKIDPIMTRTSAYDGHEYRITFKINKSADPDAPTPVEPDEPTPVEPDEPTPVEPDEPTPVEPVNKFTGLANEADENGIWWYYTDGKIDKTHTGVDQNKYGWWRVENGKVNFHAQGIYQNQYGWWKTTDGKVTFKENSIYQNEYGWWKCKDSKVDFTAQSIYENQYGWWKTTNGKVTFKENGLFSNEYGTWKVENSKVNFDFNGTYQGKTIKNGKVV